MRRARLLAAVAIACMSGAVVGVLSAQSARPSITSENPAALLLADLLTEVRGLRGEIAAAAETATRTQLLTARLQLQGQRIHTTAQQLGAVEAALSASQREIADREREIAHISDDEQRAGAEKGALLRSWLAAQRPILNEMKQRAAELQAQQKALLKTLTSEQSRATELDRRLDELELTLPKRVRR